MCIQEIIYTSKKNRNIHIRTGYQLAKWRNLMDVEEMAKKAKLKDLKVIAKKHEIKLGKCPTKLDIAKKIPRDELEDLVSK